jgi:hypothetical protein
MILAIRGHIRDAFKTKDLYFFIEKLCQLFPELKIYIHTWNIISNGISWRNISIEEDAVTEEMIHEYFGDISIKMILIEDDKKIQLHGNVDGNVSNSFSPMIGWKNYWYGKYKLIDTIQENDTVVNLRFDVLNNSNNFGQEMLIDFIIKNKETTKNVFLFDTVHPGIDNIYMGTRQTMHKLASIFFYDLDTILTKHETEHPEYLIYIVNDEIKEYI